MLVDDAEVNDGLRSLDLRATAAVSAAGEDRRRPPTCPESDVIAVLLEQHGQLDELFDAIKTATGASKLQTLDQLQLLLARHETAEQMILRSVARDLRGEGVAKSRNEDEASRRTAMGRAPLATEKVRADARPSGGGVDRRAVRARAVRLGARPRAGRSEEGVRLTWACAHVVVDPDEPSRVPRLLTLTRVA